MLTLRPGSGLGLAADALSPSLPPHFSAVRVVRGGVALTGVVVVAREAHDALTQIWVALRTPAGVPVYAEQPPFNGTPEEALAWASSKLSPVMSGAGLVSLGFVWDPDFC